MSKENENKTEKQELTPDLARACLEFLNRADLKGGEAQTMLMVQQVIKGYIK